MGALQTLSDSAALEPVTTTMADGASQGEFAPQLLEYWHAALRWKWIIVAVVATLLVFGLIWTLLTPPSYTARAQIEISREQKQITNVEGLESSSAGQDVEFYATQYALVKARPVAERVARQLRLVNDPAFYDANGLDPDAIDQEFPNLSPLQRQQKRERLVVQTLLDSVSISPVRTSRLVDISYTSRSPELSASIANAWAQAFIAVSMDRQFESTADARNFLESRLSSLRDKLESSERAVVTFASNKGIIKLDETRTPDGRTTGSRTLVGADLDALNSQLNKAVAARIFAESRLTSNGSDTAEAVTNDSLSTLRSQRAEVAAELRRQEVIFEPTYPAVQQLKRQLEALDEAIAQQTTRIAGVRKAEYEEALANELRLKRQVGELKSKLDEQQRDSIEYAIYQREADTNRQLYDALLQRYKEIGVAGTIGASNISIVESAQVPIFPSGPSLPVNLLISLFLGAGIAAGLVFVLEHVDEGIRDPSKVQQLLGLPLLGQTPQISEDVLESLQDIKSHFYEAYFSLETNLTFVTEHGFPKSLLITSTQPAEGKSSTALALAVVLGRTGKRVLLVDADMRSPSLHEMAGGDNREGLSHYLTGEHDWNRLLQDTHHKGVQLIAAGPKPPSAAELLSNKSLQQFVREGGKQFDHIIIDSPPVLGLSDAPLLARSVEGCVFVVRSEDTSLRAVRNSLARLKQVEARIFGVVLTQLQHKRVGYGYGYGYGRAYGDEQEAKSA